MRIFPRTFCDPTPTRVARNIDHRCKRPMNAGGPCFRRGDARRLSYGRRIPACRFARRYGKDCAVPVNYVEAKNHRYLETRLLDSDTLEVVRVLNAAYV